MVANLTLLGVGLFLRKQIERERMVDIAESGDRDRAALEVGNALDLGCRLRRGRERKQRQPAGHGEPLDRRALGKGGDGDLERGG